MSSQSARPSLIPTSDPVSSHRRLRNIVLAAAVVLAAAACGSAAGGGGSTVAPRAHDPLCNFAAKPPAVYQHVIWIWFEDTDEQAVNSASNGNTYASGLIDRCGYALNYHSISHPSLPNYVAATSGTVQGAAANSDCSPADCPQSQTSLFDQVHAAGNEWREYIQKETSPCGGGTAAHYPSLASQCATSVVPLGDPSSGALQQDLAHGTLPAFGFVVPDDVHDAGPVADTFLSDWVTAITASPTYKQGTTAILITWVQGRTDQANVGEHCDDTAHANGSAYPGCHVAFIAVAPAVGQSRSSDYFNHYSLLRTTEEMLGISTYLGNAAKASSMRSALHL